MMTQRRYPGISAILVNAMARSCQWRRHSSRLAVERPTSLPAVALPRAVAAGDLLDDAVVEAALGGGIEHRPAVDAPPAAGEGHALVEHDAVADAGEHEPIVA